MNFDWILLYANWLFLTLFLFPPKKERRRKGDLSKTGMNQDSNEIHRKAKLNKANIAFTLFK